MIYRSAKYDEKDDAKVVDQLEVRKWVNGHLKFLRYERMCEYVATQSD